VKLLFTQKRVDEPEVEIINTLRDEYVQKLEQYIRRYERVLVGEDNGRQYKILQNEIYYIESVDKKTFIYTSDCVYRSADRLYKIESDISSSGFIRVSKSCLINVNFLESVTSLTNSRLEAALSNGERVCVSRMYIGGIKDALSRGM
jgi:DNA-binding LytR/AlgR family response regulator